MTKCAKFIDVTYVDGTEERLYLNEREDKVVEDKSIITQIMNIDKRIDYLRTLIPENHVHYHGKFRDIERRLKLLEQK